MKKDIILAGVGGQGVLAVAAIIAQGAAREGLRVRQSEVHGMAQRGGAVLAHLRIADAPIASDLVPQGGADIIISMEPLESLRYLAWLSPDGAVVTACEVFLNIGNYPDIRVITEAIAQIPHHRMVQAAELAKQAGLARAVNMVMVGAASPYLPVSAETLEQVIGDMFASKDASLITANRKAFALGRRDSLGL
ncbi:MAG: indolepyruvate oxidoreductase subunit beta [Spirochaetaceae bacterium]|jgi:indolepyruvate ferredoxin oxidoreductase beta subunit|nr:indolepyruvate oxidoreductase subunit beta [Spirochaetaceae bacterium]